MLPNAHLYRFVRRISSRRVGWIDSATVCGNLEQSSTKLYRNGYVLNASSLMYTLEFKKIKIILEVIAERIYYIAITEQSATRSVLELQTQLMNRNGKSANTSNSWKHFM